MNNKTRKITQTALLLALLIALQVLTKPLGQLVTGSCVNGLLAISVLLCGLGSGLAIAAFSPVIAFLLGIAPNFITVLPIMLGNALYVTVLYLFLGKSSRHFWKQPVAVAVAAAGKFLLLYVLVVQVICGVAADGLLGKKLGQIVVLAPPMLEMLPAMFSLPQLITALIGGIAALLILPVLRKALAK